MRAAYELCLYLGILHPDFLLGQLTASQWNGWLAYLSICPLPVDRFDLAIAGLRANVVNGYAKRAVQEDHFVPPYGRARTRQQSMREMRDVFDGLIASEAQRRGDR